MYAWSPDPGLDVKTQVRRPMSSTGPDVPCERQCIEKHLVVLNAFAYICIPVVMNFCRQVGRFHYYRQLSELLFIAQHHKMDHLFDWG